MNGSETTMAGGPPEPTELLPPATTLTGRSAEIGNLAEALAKVQALGLVVDADETATVEGKSKRTGNTYSYDYSYASLAAVTAKAMPPLGENGLAFFSWPMYGPRGFTLYVQLVHTSGQWIGGEWTLPEDDPQATGSEMSYARRYCLQALVGVAVKPKPGSNAPADDDGRIAADRSRRESFDQATPHRPEAAATQPPGPQPPPSPLSVRLGYLKSVIREKGLIEDDAPAAFRDLYGIDIREATVEQVQVYIDHVQTTGLLGPVPAEDGDTAPASWGGPDDTAAAQQEAAELAAETQQQDPPGGEPPSGAESGVTPADTTPTTHDEPPF